MPQGLAQIRGPVRQSKPWPGDGLLCLLLGHLASRGPHRPGDMRWISVDGQSMVSGSAERPYIAVMKTPGLAPPGAGAG
ncbi:hypothetical protein ACIQPP_43310 [Streptomyces violaceusniger]|uniref:hypothetical protein n=1 Tax=Streptomyces violaceusniger TaxID=68280 RepID=UPI00131CA22D|nr:hypothetical protein [Streptomyces hygroscopicus]